MKPVLEVAGLTQDFGGLRALNELDLTVHEKEIVALIGPNGAGKTTFFNCVTGIYKPTGGTMYLTTRDGNQHLLNGMKTHAITALGMARTFQNIRLFSEMTVLENVMIGRHCRTHAGILSALLRDPRTVREEQDTIDKSYDLLKTVGLETFWNETAHNLPYGAQRRLEIARALATEPILLLLDEPTRGIDVGAKYEIYQLILNLAKEGKTVLMVSSEMPELLGVCDRILVMSGGQLAGEVDARTTTQEEIMALAAKFA